MKKLLISPFFLLSSTLFIVHQFIEKRLHIHIPFVDSYLDNLLFFPIMLTLITIERKVITRNTNYKLTTLEIGIITIFLSVLFEEVVPLYFSAFTRDNYDYVAYAIGALMFYFQRNK